MKNIRMLTTAAICLLLSNLGAQKTIELDAFDSVLASGNLELVLIPGDAERAIVEISGAPQDELSVKTVRGELRINYINALIYKNYEAKVTVWYKSLRSVRGNAGARIRSDAPLTSNHLELRAASGSIVELSIDVQSLEASASEGGMLRVGGKAQSQDANAITGGQYEAFRLDCQNTYVRASLGGQAEVVALKKLEATAHTGGSIEYRGDPEQSNVRNIISGDIRRGSR